MIPALLKRCSTEEEEVLTASLAVCRGIGKETAVFKKLCGVGEWPHTS